MGSPLTDTDGRRARRDRNREAVVDAFLDLFRQGDLKPSAAVVAERSGVSLRSVFRYFDDLDEMGRIAIERHAETVRPLLELPHIGEGDRSARIASLVEHRMTLHHHVAPVVRATLLRAPFQPVLAAGLEVRRKELHAQIEVHFAPELADIAPGRRWLIVDAVDVVMSFESAEQLLEHRQLSPEDCAELLTTTLDQLIPDPSRR
jgi:AcrR family transcriptional regulator